MIAAELFALAALAKVLAPSEAPPLAIDPVQQGLAAAAQQASNASAQDSNAEAPAEEPQVDERPHVHNSSLPS